MTKIDKKLTKVQIKKLEKKEFNKKLKLWKQQIILRDNSICQKCSKDLTDSLKHPHHIIALQSVIRKYPELLEDLDNGILLCPYCHKWAPDSPHQGGFEFSLFLKNKFPERYKYLMDIINMKNGN